MGTKNGHAEIVTVRGNPRFSMFCVLPVCLTPHSKTHSNWWSVLRHFRNSSCRFWQKRGLIIRYSSSTERLRFFTLHFGWEFSDRIYPRIWIGWGYLSWGTTPFPWTYTTSFLLYMLFTLLFSFDLCPPIFWTCFEDMSCSSTVTPTMLTNSWAQYE